MKDYRFTVEVKGLSTVESIAAINAIEGILGYIEQLELADKTFTVRAVGDVVDSGPAEEIAKAIANEVFLHVERFVDVEISHFDYASVPKEIYVPDRDDFRAALEGQEDEQADEGEQESDEDTVEPAEDVEASEAGDAD